MKKLVCCVLICISFFRHSFGANGKDSLQYVRSSVPAQIHQFEENQSGILAIVGDNLYLRSTKKGQILNQFRVGENGQVQSVANVYVPQSQPVDLTSIVFKGVTYFASNGTQGKELYSIDQQGSIQLVADINVGTEGAYPENFILFENELYFVADGGSQLGKELYKIDTEGQLQLVKDLQKGAASSYPNSFTIYNDNLYFLATSSKFGRELHRIDATGSVHLVTDLHEGTGDAFPLKAEIVEHNNGLYFMAHGGSKIGRELFTLQSNQVSLVTDINKGSADSFPNQLTSFKHKLYFTAKENNQWKLFEL